MTESHKIIGLDDLKKAKPDMMKIAGGLFEAIAKKEQESMAMEQFALMMQFTELCLKYKKKPKEVWELLNEVDKELGILKRR